MKGQRGFDGDPGDTGDKGQQGPVGPTVQCKLLFEYSILCARPERTFLFPHAQGINASTLMKNSSEKGDKGPRGAPGQKGDRGEKVRLRALSDLLLKTSFCKGELDNNKVMVHDLQGIKGRQQFTPVYSSRMSGFHMEKYMFEKLLTEARFI